MEVNKKTNANLILQNLTIRSKTQSRQTAKLQATLEDAVLRTAEIRVGSQPWEKEMATHESLSEPRWRVERAGADPVRPRLPLWHRAWEPRVPAPALGPSTAVGTRETRAGSICVTLLFLGVSTMPFLPLGEESSVGQTKQDQTRELPLPAQPERCL